VGFVLLRGNSRQRRGSLNDCLIRSCDLKERWKSCPTVDNRGLGSGWPTGPLHKGGEDGSGERAADYGRKGGERGGGGGGHGDKLAYIIGCLGGDFRKRGKTWL